MQSMNVVIANRDSQSHLDKAINAFTKVGKKYGVLGMGKKEIVEKFGL